MAGEAGRGTASDTDFGEWIILACFMGFGGKAAFRFSLPPQNALKIDPLLF
jgi:hypothetical protein